MEQLSKIQAEAVAYMDGAMLVLADAGSGKTRVLTERIYRLASVTKRQILALTFTNKAGEEIKSRIKDMGDDISKKIFVGTFHTFCMHVLETHGAGIGSQHGTQIFSETKDLMVIAAETIEKIPSYYQSYIRKSGTEKEHICRERLSFVSNIKKNFISTETLHRCYSEEDIAFYEIYNSLLHEQHSIDFDDLLLLTYELFQSKPHITRLYRRNYEYICIDEAQDLNKAQYMVLRALTGNDHKQVMMVGDSKQSIYAFNGASSDYMNVKFKKDFAPVKEFRLSENYRSAQKIVDYANKLFPELTSTSKMAFEGCLYEKGCEDVEYEAKLVITLIKRLLTGGGTHYFEGTMTTDRICVLARNQYLLSPIEEKLKENGIEYYFKTTSKRFDFSSDIGKTLYLSLMVRINPADNLHLKDLSEIADKCKGKDFPESNEVYAQVYKGIMAVNDDGSNMSKILESIRKVIIEKGSKDEEMRVGYEEIAEIERQWKNFVKSTSTPTIQSFRNTLALGQSFLKEEIHGIALSTVHTMKGQEKDVVFLIGLDDNTFPDYRAVRSGGEAMKQEKNNLYVAITRAKRILIITYPKTRIMPWGDISQRKRSSLLPPI